MEKEFSKVPPLKITPLNKTAVELESVEEGVSEQ
jgi:hypothetical protein